MNQLFSIDNPSYYLIRLVGKLHGSGTELLAGDDSKSLDIEFIAISSQHPFLLLFVKDCSGSMLQLLRRNTRS